MIDIHLEIVWFALALHLDLDPEWIQPGHRLEGDLGLDPLDLVLIALRLEEIENEEFPVADLETVTTVFDLVTIVRAWSKVPSDSHDAETLPPPALIPVRTKSGMHPIATAVIPFGRLASH